MDKRKAIFDKMKYVRSIMLNILMIIGIIFFHSCSGTERDKINFYIGSDIPREAANIHFCRIQPSSDYRRPYNVYIKFQLDQLKMEDFVKSIGLVAQSDNYRKLLCLETADSSYVSRLFNFQTRDSAESNDQYKEILDWWNPNGEKLKLYFSFYTETGSARIQHCFYNKWDGKILLGYDKIKENVYILIEVLM